MDTIKLHRQHRADFSSSKGEQQRWGNRVEQILRWSQSIYLSSKSWHLWFNRHKITVRHAFGLQFCNLSSFRVIYDMRIASGLIAAKCEILSSVNLRFQTVIKLLNPTQFWAVPSIRTSGRLGRRTLFTWAGFESLGFRRFSIGALCNLCDPIRWNLGDRLLGYSKTECANHKRNRCCG